MKNIETIIKNIFSRVKEWDFVLINKVSFLKDEDYGDCMNLYGTRGNLEAICYMSEWKDIQELFKQYFGEGSQEELAHLSLSRGIYTSDVKLGIKLWEIHGVIWYLSGKDPITYISETEEYINKFGKDE